jgi:hypothetical protein
VYLSSLTQDRCLQRSFATVRKEQRHSHADTNEAGEGLYRGPCAAQGVLLDLIVGRRLAMRVAYETSADFGALKAFAIRRTHNAL